MFVLHNKKNIVTIADGNVRGVPLGIADYDHMTDFYYVDESVGFYRWLIFYLLDSFSEKKTSNLTRSIFAKSMQ